MEFNKMEGGLYNIVNPLSPYFMCDYYISDELDTYVWREDFDKSLIKGVDLLKKKDYSVIKDYDIIQVQVSYFGYFLEEVLPFIKGKRIVLFTSQFEWPAVHKSIYTDELLENPSILLWVSQNPIYTEKNNYMAFPYGIHQSKANFYFKFMKNNRVKKSISIPNLKLSIQSVLEEEHIRVKNPLLGEDSGDYLYYYDFLKTLLESKFIISPEGDRHDNSRHMESIGLGAIPICNVNLEEIYGNSMIYADESELNNMALTGVTDRKYVKPNKNLVLFEWWKKKVLRRIEELK